MLFCLLYSYKTKMQEMLLSINMNLSQDLRYEYKEMRSYDRRM